MSPVTSRRFVICLVHLWTTLGNSRDVPPPIEELCNSFRFIYNTTESIFVEYIFYLPFSEK